MDITLHGLLFFVVAGATVPVCLVGALVQLVVVRLRAPVGRVSARNAAGVVGPLLAGVVGLLGAVYAAESSLESRRGLDDAWWVLIALQLVVWVGTTWWLVLRARKGDGDWARPP